MQCGFGEGRRLVTHAEPSYCEIRANLYESTAMFTRYFIAEAGCQTLKISVI